MDVIAAIGERIYHAAGSACHQRLMEEEKGPLLSLTAAQAHEVGMEPCGFCFAPSEGRQEPTKGKE